MEFKIQNSKFKIFLISLLTFGALQGVLLLSSTALAVESTSSAQVPDIGYARIDPASPFYFLKTVRENIEKLLAKTERVKELRKLEFATRRLREARTLIGKNEDLIPPTLEKYVAHLNTITDKHIKGQPFADEMKNNLAVHLNVLLKMYESTQNNRTKMSIRSTLNRVIQRVDVANLSKIPVCVLFAKEATSSALNEVEQLVLQERSTNCTK